MVNIDWEEARHNVFKFLDTKELIYDISKAQEHHYSVHELMDYLEEKYPYKDKFSDTLFDCIDQGNFIEYIEERYEIKAIEQINYYF